jgi:5'-nucleotidase
MHILISNDDGFRANGINFLKDTLTKDFKVTMIAPDQERSCCGHGITLGEPIRVDKINSSTYACSGYPADCILIGVGNICKSDRPDLVISGINHGANLGQDRYYSGTIAAAREAAFRNIPAIAVSLVTQNIKDVEHFEVASNFINELVKKDIHKFIPPMCLLNVNVPNLPQEKIAGIKLTNIGYQKYSEEIVERVDTRGKSYYWVGGTYQGYSKVKGTDCFESYHGYISVNLQTLADQDSSSYSDSINKLKSILQTM